MSSAVGGWVSERVSERRRDGGTEGVYDHVPFRTFCKPCVGVKARGKGTEMDLFGTHHRLSASFVSRP